MLYVSVEFLLLDHHSVTWQPNASHWSPGNLVVWHFLELDALAVTEKILGVLVLACYNGPPGSIQGRRFIAPDPLDRPRDVR